MPQLAKTSREAEFMAALGARLRDLRETAGLRQGDIAACANAAGLSWGRSSVASLERGTRGLSAFEWLALPAIYRCDADALLVGVDARPAAALPRPTELDRRAAVLLAATPERVVEAAVALWGRSFSAERDARCSRSGADRSTFAARGHVTRSLLDQLTAALAP